MRIYEPYLKKYSRKLRKEMTEEEKKLWYKYLRSYPNQFRRQLPIKQFIVDFYCSEAKLAIEIDGSQHYEEEKVMSDVKRDEILSNIGIKVIRYNNRQINTEFRSVCEDIDRIVKSRIIDK